MHRRLRLFTLLGLLALISIVHAEPPAGLRIATAGHSFHVWMPGLLNGLVKDAGIENFVKLGLQHNPALRITVQEFWMTFDDGSLWGKPLNGKVVDRDSKTMTDLHAAHDDYFKGMDDHVRELNAKYAKDKPAIFVVPVGQAVMELRSLIIEGKAPGIAKQSELFTDPIGHPRDQVKALSAYCHYAVVYGRSPVGLPMPAAIAKLPEADKLNALLQKLAWDAVTAHPLSGVKP
jgi:hypothetical protein